MTIPEPETEVQVQRNRTRYRNGGVAVVTVAALPRNEDDFISTNCGQAVVLCGSIAGEGTGGDAC